MLDRRVLRTAVQAQARTLALDFRLARSPSLSLGAGARRARAERSELHPPPSIPGGGGRLIIARQPRSSRPPELHRRPARQFASVNLVRCLTRAR
jgi:hypothetical protein